MRLGWLRSLFCAFLMFIGIAHAESLTQQQVNNWLENQTLNSKASEYTKQALLDEIDELSFSLSQLKYPQQEAVRLLMLREIESTQIPISSTLALFIQEQSQTQATYKLITSEDGYEVTTIAFPFPQIAARILKQSQRGEEEMDFYVEAEGGELNLVTWLSPESASEQLSRQELLITEFNQLSSKAQGNLIAQVTGQDIVTWLPQSKVLIELARQSKNAEMYDLLWRVKPNRHIEAEIARLAEQGDDFSINQLINSATNPSLYDSSLDLLVDASLTSSIAEGFIVAELGNTEKASSVARQFVQKGKGQSLIRLFEKSPTLNVTQLDSLLAQ